MSHVMDIEEIRTLLPHRYPFLLVDRVLEITPGKHIVGLKNVSINEAYFNGHFPSQAIMPGVIILECMAQVAGLAMLIMPEHQGKLALIGAMDNAKFRRPVVPGDTLRIEAFILKVRGGVGKVRMSASVEGEVVAECEMTFALKERGSHATGEGTSV